MHTPRTAFQGIPLGRAALWLGLVAWTVSLLRTPLPQLGGSFFHLIDLVFHEAGHVIFWEAILMALGWLHLDHTIARAAWMLGAVTMICALIYSFFVLRSSTSSN